MTLNEDAVALSAAPDQVTRSPLTRRRFLLISAAVAGTSLLAACGGDDSPPTPTRAPAATQAGAPSGGAPTAATAPTVGAASSSPAAATSASPAAQAGQQTGTVGQLPQSAAAGKAGGKKIFRTASTPDIQFMDPAKITGNPDYVLGEAIFNYIGRYTYTPPLGTDIKPELAEKWEISPDAKVYTFYIRKGVKFHHDYGDVTAEEVKANWARILDKATASRYQTDFAGASLDVADPYTLKVSFANSYPAFIPASLAFRPGLIMSIKAFTEKGDQWKTAPIGSGPFQWGKLEPGVSVTLDRFDGYWGPKPKVDQILFKVKVDERAGVLAVARAELDAIYILDPDIALEVQRRPDPNTVFLKAGFGTAPYWLAYNMKRPPLDDIKVRQALRYAIDVNSIAKDLFGGLADPIHSFLPPFMFGYTDNVMKFNYDPNKAKSLLAEANVDLSSWQPSMIGSSSQAATRKIHEVVGSYWNDVGVKVKVDLLESGIVQERREKGDYDMYGVFPTRIEPDQLATPYWRSGSTVNNSFYSAADDLIDRAKSEPDVNKRKELYAQLQQKISTDSPAAYIVAVSTHLLVNKRVAGLSGAAWQERIDWFNVDVPAE